MPYLQPFTFEQLLSARKTVVKISIVGFLNNVSKSLECGLISNEQKELLLAGLIDLI